MQSIETILNNIADFVWGQPLLILLVGTHLYLTVRLGFVQRYLEPVPKAGNSIPFRQAAFSF
jgi:Na+/alanine symporter